MLLSGDLTVSAAESLRKSNIINCSWKTGAERAHVGLYCFSVRVFLTVMTVELMIVTCRCAGFTRASGYMDE